MKDVASGLAEMQAHCSGSDGRPWSARSVGIEIYGWHVGASKLSTPRAIAKRGRRCAARSLAST